MREWGGGGERGRRLQEKETIAQKHKLIPLFPAYNTLLLLLPNYWEFRHEWYYTPREYNPYTIKHSDFYIIIILTDF